MVTNGMQIAKDTTSRLHHAASKRPSDTAERLGFETECQGIRHITNGVFIGSPRSDRT